MQFNALLFFSKANFLYTYLCNWTLHLLTAKPRNKNTRLQLVGLRSLVYWFRSTQNVKLSLCRIVSSSATLSKPNCQAVHCHED